MANLLRLPPDIERDLEKKIGPASGWSLAQRQENDRAARKLQKEIDKVTAGLDEMVKSFNRK